LDGQRAGFSQQPARDEGYKRSHLYAGIPTVCPSDLEEAIGPWRLIEGGFQMRKILLAVVLVALFSIVLSSCKKEEPAEETSYETSETPAATNTTSPDDQILVTEQEVAKNFPEYKPSTGRIVKVFYATDRRPTGSPEPNTFFGAEPSPSGNLLWGTCDVSIPNRREIGTLPGIGKSVREENPNIHIVLLRVRTLTRNHFFSQLQTDTQGAPKHELLVFIHGFNVEFKDAVRRTAQLAVDLGFEGIPVTYSWPSFGTLSHRRYEMDTERARWTAPHLEKFLIDLADSSGATSIHLITHSMGADALTTALHNIALRYPPRLPIFTDVVFAAPDVGSADFITLAEDFKRTGRRVTLYASSNDKALRKAAGIKGFPRAGQSGPQLVVLPGVETIDVSAADTSVIGHFYYGSKAAILSDMTYLIRQGLPPHDRFGLEERKKNGLPYWRYKG
jgi:esterase/lipase superfamily enzyme